MLLAAVWAADPFQGSAEASVAGFEAVDFAVACPGVDSALEIVVEVAGLIGAAVAVAVGVSVEGRARPALGGSWQTVAVTVPGEVVML
jgi:hypothetical protein